MNDIARRLRGRIVRMSHDAGSAHLGSALSCVDILVAAYWGALAIDPARPAAPGRDRFILSKGHAAAALYAALAHRGFFDPALLDGFAREGGRLAEHPGPNCAPGVEAATGSVLVALLPVLDDVDRARQHGDLTGAFKAVADQLEATLEKLGLSPYGAEGDPFDPTLHEAVASQPSPAVTEPTCVAVLRRGYKLGERILRVPLVAVAEPSGEPAGAQDSAEPPAEWFGDEQRPE